MDQSANVGHNHELQYATLVGPTVEAEPELIELAYRNGLGSDRTTFHKRGTAIFALNRSIAQRSLATRPTALKSLDDVVGSYGPRLVSIYQQHVSLQLPIIDQSFFLACQQGNIQEVDPVLLASIYAIALPWLLDEEDDLSHVLHTKKIGDAAFTIFSDSLRNPSLATLQAGMLLMQMPSADSKTLNSQLVNAAYELGLHLDCTEWDISVTEKALRKRLAWSMYMQDKWCSLIHGRPSLISSSNWAVPDVADEDFASSSTGSQGSHGNSNILYQQIVELTKILATILETFYTLDAMAEIEESGSNGTRLILERAKPVQIDLKEWFTELPAALKMDSLDTQYSSSIGTLAKRGLFSDANIDRLPAPCLLRN